MSSDLLASFRRVATSNLSDVLEFEFGVRQYLRRDIKPLFPCHIAGRAVTLLELESREDRPNPMQHLFEAVDACDPGSVLVATNPHPAASVLGDLVALALDARGAEGAVLDGAARDVEAIARLQFPVFCSSITPASAKHKAVSIGHNLPIQCGGVQVHPGDIIVGDRDGVVVVPQDIAGAVLDKTLALEQKEEGIARRIREAIREKKLADIFAEFS